MPKLQDIEILFVAAEDLRADRKTFGRRPGRHRGFRVSVVEMYQQDFIQLM
jgi:hypothetical protein